MSILKVENLTKKYTRKDTEFSAVDNVSFEIYSSELVFIVGESGSGKSTLLNSTVGFIKPDSGTVNLGNTLLTALNDKKLSRFRNKNIGFIPQGHSILANLTVAENITLPYWLYNKKPVINDKLHELLELTGITHLANQYPSEISGGELRRVAIARSLINDSPIIIADEPISNLDEKTGEGILNLFTALPKKGVSLLIVTHNRGDLKYASRSYEMTNGKLAVI